MKTKYETSSITNNVLTYYIMSSERGTGTIGPLTSNYLDLPDVSNLVDFETIYQVSYTVEDVGSIEVWSIYQYLLPYTKGNGTLRTQVSGDGGSNWSIIGQVSFNNAAFTLIVFPVIGQFISTIESGLNKFQIKVEVKATVGTVNNKMHDLSYIRLSYRKKLLS